MIPSLDMNHPAEVKFIEPVPDLGQVIRVYIQGPMCSLGDSLERDFYITPSASRAYFFAPECINPKAFCELLAIELAIQSRQATHE